MLFTRIEFRFDDEEDVDVRERFSTAVDDGVGRGFLGIFLRLLIVVDALALFEEVLANVGCDNGSCLIVVDEGDLAIEVNFFSVLIEGFGTLLFNVFLVAFC